MQPFELPDFYVPWPARLNPNLDVARAHSKVWAYEVGILGTAQDESTPKIWDERDFERHDYALFCAYIHPETPGPELNLMTDWNVWAFYVDDYFLQVYKQANDHAGAKRYLDRVPLFMPVDLDSMPPPTNPMERGLSDVWMRTAPSKSEVWRKRIIESTKSLLDASIRELDSMSEQRLANPIEYMAMRRQVGGALWSADLVEHAEFVEIPERIAATRPIQVLKDTFADSVHLRNDIFSYQREVLKDGELTNAVLVVERFLSVDTQRAVNLVNDLLTCRLQRFEHVVLTELAPIFDEYGLDPIERANTLTYIRGLQDWQSGAHEWHIQTSRYLNPGAGKGSNTAASALPGLPVLGTAAMQITPGTLKLSMNRFKSYKHIPYKKVGPTRLPEFYMPFATQANPHLDAARRNAKAWARRMGMLDTLPEHPAISIWDEHKFDAADVVSFCALAYPKATAPQLDLTVYWIVWATYADDYFPAVYGRTRDIIGAKVFHARLSEFMPIEPNSPVPPPLTPIERGLTDMWAHASEMLSANERRSFRKIVEGMIGSWIWELSDQIQNRIPDPIDYIEMRRKTTGGASFAMLIPRSKDGQGGPAEVYQARIIQELNNIAIDYVGLTNDIVSYQKEIEFEGEIHNVVLVIENFLGCDQIQAVKIVNDLMATRIKQFEYIVATEIPVLFKNFDLDSHACEQLYAYIEALQHFMCGSLQWHTTTGRYKEFELRRSAAKPFSGKPTGLGTTAARILSRGSGENSISPALKPPQQTQESFPKAPNTVKPFAVSHLAPFFLSPKKEANSTD